MKKIEKPIKLILAGLLATPLVALAGDGDCQEDCFEAYDEQLGGCETSCDQLPPQEVDHCYSMCAAQEASDYLICLGLPHCC